MKSDFSSSFFCEHLCRIRVKSESAPDLVLGRRLREETDDDHHEAAEEEDHHREVHVVEARHDERPVVLFTAQRLHVNEVEDHPR